MEESECRYSGGSQMEDKFENKTATSMAQTEEKLREKMDALREEFYSVCSNLEERLQIMGDMINRKTDK